MTRSLAGLAEYQDWLNAIKQQLAAARIRFAAADKSPFGQHPVDQIPRGHNILIFTRYSSFREAKFALRDMNEPMGVSEYTLVEALPDNLKGAMPTVEEIEYHADKRLQPLVGEIAWAHNLVIMSRCKDPLQREFYLRSFGAAPRTILGLEATEN